MEVGASSEMFHPLYTELPCIASKKNNHLYMHFIRICEKALGLRSSRL